MKKYIKLVFCLFITALAGIFHSYGQVANSNVLQGLQSNFKQYNAIAFQEKLFVHTDKAAYTAGELMWFKVYNVDRAYHKPIDLSKVVYVEVLDKNQNPVLQAKIAMTNGAGSGSLFLPVSLTSGNFILRAYTSWMKNFSPDYYFHKSLLIINPAKSPAPASKLVAANFDVQFFPEGGNLVNGITSTIGIKATNQYGSGVNFTGAIVDKSNDTVVRFKPLKFGIGRFVFTPDSHNTYKAIIKIGDKTLQQNIPPINESGYVMHVKDDNGSQIRVSVSTNAAADKVYLFVHTRNVIKAIEAASAQSGIATFTIDKNKLGDGISQLTVFNNQQQAVCERLYFKRPANQLIITAAADAHQYATRKKVDININAKRDDNSRADMSLSVYRIDTLQHADQLDIQNYLWLSSDLKGNIESPEYYFKNTDVVANEAIDNLMLTQGWRRFDWNEIASNKKNDFKFLPEYNGPIITGKLTSTINNMPQWGIVTFLAIPGKRVQLYASQSDSTGALLFNMKNFYGPGEIVVQTNTQHDTSFRIDILNPFSEQYAKIQSPELSLTPGMQSSLENSNLGTQVQNIYNGEKLRQFYDPHIDSTAFFGVPYKTYLLDNYTRFTTMEEVMREYVSEVNIVHPHNHFHIKVLNKTSFLDEGDPLVMIDGVPFFNIDKVFAADPLKIKKLDDVPYIFLTGPSYEAGIFSFTTYRGDLAGNEIDPHAVVLDYEGLELQREFYSPQYDTAVAAESRIPDFRNVLYWEPFVKTDAKGSGTISFYTSDQTGKYIGIVQGLNSNGQAGSQTFTFDVVK